MNAVERQMLDLLKRGRDDHGFVAVKAEFEAEGTRPDEFLRLLELAARADLKVALKIGGCEAISDLLSSHLYGVDYVIAPMIETPYALSKFVEAKNKTHAGGNGRTSFLFNLETQTALDNLDDMVGCARGELAGIVFGRVDFTLSRGMDRTAVNERSITDAVLTVAHACASSDLELVVGGSVALAAIEPLREIAAVRLDRFETRKIVFAGDSIHHAGIEDGIAAAVDFELLWLKNKRAYYQRIAEEDDARIAMMEQRAQQAALAITR